MAMNEKIINAELALQKEPLGAPFGFKGGTLSELWQVAVRLGLSSGEIGTGVGVQSVLWSDPTTFCAFDETGGNNKMLAVTRKALSLLKGAVFTTPPQMIKDLVLPLMAYAQNLLGRADVPQTFVLNALVPIDFALWQIWNAKQGTGSFDAIAQTFCPQLVPQGNALGGIPLISYNTSQQEIETLLQNGTFLLKAKIGADPHKDNNPEAMLQWDIERLRSIHAIATNYSTPNTDCGRPVYYLDANGRYPNKTFLLRFLDAADKMGALERIVLLEGHMYAEDEEVTKPHKRLLQWAENYNATNTDNIEVVVSGAKTADVIMTTIASGNTPDIFQNYWNNAPTWADNGALYDLTDFVNGGDAEWNKADFIDSAWEVCVYNDKVYSVPFTFSSTFLFYDKDALAAAGWDKFPETMEELAQCICDCTVVNADGSIEKMGLIPDYPWLDNVLWPIAFGASYIDNVTNTITFDSPEMISAYQFQADIYNDFGYSKVKRFVDTLGARATTEDPLFTGKLAIRWQADSAVASMVDAANETGTNMGIAAMPPATKGGESQSMLSCGVWEVNAKTANADATLKVLKSLTGAEHMAFMAEGDFGNGAFMPRTSALNALLEMDVTDEAKQIATLLRDGEVHAFPMSPYVNEYLTEISTYMTEALAGNISVEDAAKSVVESVQPLADAAG